MPTNAPAKRSTVYVIPQATAATEPAFDITKAVRVVSCETRVVNTAIRREDHDQPNDGGLPTVAAGYYRSWNIVVELRKPVTPGSKSTWQLLALFEACAVAVTDQTSASRVETTPRSGRIPFTHFTPVAVYKYEVNGRRLASIDTVFTVTDVKGDPNGIVMVTLEGRGTCLDDEAADADDVAQVYTYTVSTEAAANWTFTLLDDEGNREVLAVAGDAGGVNDCAAALRTNLGTPELVNVTGSGADVVLTAKRKGRVITVTVTPGSGGAGSGSVTTARVNRAEKPTYSNEGAVVVWMGGTVTDSRGTLLNVGAWSLAPNVGLVDRAAGDATNGYAMARHGKGGYATLALAHDVQPFADLDNYTPLVDQTTESITIATADFAVACPQVTVGEQSESERESDRGYDDTLLCYSTAGNTDHWKLTLY